MPATLHPCVTHMYSNVRRRTSHLLENVSQTAHGRKIQLCLALHWTVVKLEKSSIFLISMTGSTCVSFSSANHRQSKKLNWDLILASGQIHSNALTCFKIRASTYSKTVWFLKFDPRFVVHEHVFTVYKLEHVPYMCRLGFTSMCVFRFTLIIVLQACWNI